MHGSIVDGVWKYSVLIVVKMIIIFFSLELCLSTNQQLSKLTVYLMHSITV